MPRPEGKDSCLLCGCDEFTPVREETPGDFVLRLIAGHRFDAAHANLERLVAAVCEDTEPARRLAWLAYALEDFRAVETWCHECERLDDGSPEPHLLLGVFFHARRALA